MILFGRFGKVKKTVSAGTKDFVLQANTNLFARLLITDQSHDIDLSNLTHELGPFPWSLAAFDGSLAEPSK